MSNYTQVKQELMNYIHARTPLVIINTSERERVENILNEIVIENQISILYYTESKQVKAIGSSAESMDTEDDPIGYFTKHMKRQRNLNIVIGDVRKISEDNAYSRSLVNLLYMAKEYNGVVVIVTADHIWTRISNFGLIIDLEYPDTMERINQVQKFVNQYSGRYPSELDKEDIIHIAAILRGFTEIQINNILSAEIVGGQGLYKKNISKLCSQKQRLYPKIGSVQYLDQSKQITVAGMDVLKNWLTAKRKIFFMPDQILQNYDIKPPKGILMVGVPGCGKSLTAKLVAQEWELPLFRFDIGAVFDKWVGESEKKMREALRFIENVSPCILWIDEIEKVLATTEMGNETGKRVLGEFLFWLQESSGKVFMVATANNVDALPYELYRKGRFSEVFFAGLPTAEERKAAIKYYIIASLKIEPTEQLLEKLVSNTDGYSYSDLETAIKEVAQTMLIGNTKTISINEIIQAVNEVIPITKINPELVKNIEIWGMERAINASKNAGGVCVE